MQMTTQVLVERKHSRETQRCGKCGRTFGTLILPPGTVRTKPTADLLVQVVKMDCGELASDGPRDAELLEVGLHRRHADHRRHGGGSANSLLRPVLCEPVW